MFYSTGFRSLSFALVGSVMSSIFAFFCMLFCLLFSRVFHCYAAVHLPFRSFFAVIIIILPCVALSLFGSLVIFHTEFWSTSLPFSQQVVSMTQKLDCQFLPPVNPGHLCIIPVFSMDGSHSPWKCLISFLFHSVFVAFIQIGFNHPLCLLYFQVVPRFGRSLSSNQQIFALAAKTGNGPLAPSPHESIERSLFTQIFRGLCRKEHI